MQRFVCTADEQSRFAKCFDRELGWKGNFSTRHGERPVKNVYPKDIMATFGDSFTFGYDVADEETWQAQTARIINGNVLNFGVCAYGTDQALLMFRKVFREIMPVKFAMLGVITENIGRTVSVFRKFYSFDDGHMTKPRFVVSNNDLLELLPNPIQEASEIKKMAEVEFIKELGKNDYWFQRLSSMSERVAFPVTALLFSREFWSEIYFSAIGEKRNLWLRDPAAEALNYKIYDAFVAESKRANAIPIFLLIPSKKEIRSYFQSNQLPPAIGKIKKYCVDKEYFIINVIEYQPLASYSKNIDSLYGKNSHPSSEFCGIIGNNICAALREKNLLAQPEQ